MSRLSLAPIDGNVFQRAMGHRPEIMKAWFDLDVDLPIQEANWTPG